MCDRATLPPPPPPAAPVPWQTRTWSFPGRPEQLRHARALLAGFLDGYPAAATTC